MAEIFLRLDNISGESIDAVGGGPPHIDEIQVFDWNWGLTNSAPLEMKSAEATTQTSAQSLSITKGIDKASATLAQFCALGTEIPTGTLTCRKNAGDQKLEYLVIDFKKVKVIDLKWNEQGHEHGASEVVLIRFGEFKIKYTMQADATGEALGTVEFGFDIQHHKQT
jgi:type VI secretion system secreted protein Hcp